MPMRQGREHENRRYGDQNGAVSMRDNVLAAIVVVLLLAAAVSLTDELAEDSQSCYRPDGGCGAWGIPTAEITFEDFFQE
jgi:hypothetical protein